MATNYPTSLDTGSTTLRTDITATTELDDAGFYHDEQHVNAHGAVIAVETKLGVGSSDASAAGAGTVLVHSGSGSTGWSAAATGVTSVGTLSSLTVSGDVTVDTDTLYVDSTNNRVGIGTTAPETPLSIVTTNKLGSTFTGTTDGEGLRVDQSNYTSGNYVSLVEASYQDDQTEPHVRIAAMFDGGGSHLSFGTSNSYGSGITNQALTISEAGNVGIGTTSPGAQLEIANTGAGQLYATADGFYVDQSKSQLDTLFLRSQGPVDISSDFDGGTTNDYIRFLTDNSTERMRIDSSGNVGIGTTVPRVQLELAAPAGGSDREAIRICANGDSGSTQGKVYMGLAPWNTGTYPAARIGAEETSSGDYGASIVFQTRETAADVVPTTKVTITEAGDVGIGTNSPNGRFHVYDGANLLYVQAVTGAQNLFLPVVYARTTASAGTSQRLESSGQFRRSTSAAKYKKDIEDMDVDRAEVVYDLRPVWYRSAIETDRPDHSYYGFIADEVVDLDPRLVEFDDETGEVEGFFYPMLTSHLVKIAQMQKATIDSQQAQIDDLAARIEALEVN